MKKILFLISFVSVINTSFPQNVGIGTNTPQYLLHMKSGNDAVNGIDAGSLGAAWNYFLQDGNLRAAVGWSNINNALTFYVNGSDRIVILNNGNIGIGTTTPNGSAILETNSTTQGFLPPRMTFDQRNAIALPAQGLMIYCTNCGGGEIEVFNGVTWTTMMGNTTTKPLVLGDFYQGGIVSYFLQPGDPGYVANQVHGLIVNSAPTILSNLWGCQVTVGTSTVFGSGRSNTTMISTNACAQSNLAAVICNDLTVYGYDDWYLPSRDELVKLYANKNVFSNIIVNTNIFSSSEFSSGGVWVIDFLTGIQGTDSKGNQLKYWAVRSF